jgi:hypothetical protein
VRKTWILDTETKGTGANVVPLEKAEKKAAPRPRAARRPSPPAGSKPPARPKQKAEKTSGPLPPGHVRKKSTGEIGRVKAVDPKAGTASVFWLKHGTTSTVPLSAISRR